MKFEVRNCRTGDLLFVVDIPAYIHANGSVLLRLAMLWAVENNQSLKDASLVDAYLSGVDLKGVDLSGADLSGADLRGVDLRGAKLAGADLSHAVLDPDQQLAVFLGGAELNCCD